MQVLISRWGDNLGVHIPEDIAAHFGLAGGERVEVEASAGRIVISIPQRGFRLEDLLVGMTPQTMHEAFDWGPDIGREIVD